MRETSIEAYNKIREAGTLSKQRWVVYDCLFHHGPMTSRELDHRLSSPGDHAASYHKRLSELERMGFVKVVGEGKDGITGYRAVLWDVTMAREPVDSGKPPEGSKVRDTRRFGILESDLRGVIHELRGYNDMFTSNLARKIEDALRRYKDI